jgi:uncharacterized protein
MADPEVVKLLRDGYAAYSRGDLDTVLNLLADDVELVPPPSSPEPQPLRGREAVRRYLLPDLFDDQRAEPEEFVERGDRIMVVARVLARGSGSGVELDQTVFHVWTLERGRAVRLEVHVDRDEALAALEGKPA